MIGKDEMKIRQNLIRNCIIQHGGRCKVPTIAKSLGVRPASVYCALDSMFDIAEEDNGELFLV